jgi:CRP-like cAMP-binding protein
MIYPLYVKDRLPHTLKARETLFRQDAEATEIYFLVSGRIRLVRHTASGHAVTLHVAQESGLFAEGALFSDRYKCDAVADVKSAVIGIKKAN